MFCGWQAFFDYNELVELGDGKLTIDALSGKCLFNDTPINQLSISKALQHWLKEDCEKNKIDLNWLLEGQLMIDLKFSEINWDDRKYSDGEQFFYDERPIKMEKMHRCYFLCESFIKTDEKIYQSRHKKIREWPYGWPKSS